MSNSILQVYAATKMAALANYLISNNWQKFIETLFFIFLLWFMSFIIGLLESYVQEIRTQNILSDIRLDIANSITKLPLAEFNKKLVDYYESYLQNDTNMIQKEGIDTFFLIIRFSSNAFFR